VSLLFLVLGMLVGSDGQAGVWFDQFDVALHRRHGRAGDHSLPRRLQYRHHRGPQVSSAPATVLATVGVIGIAALTAVGGHAFGLHWPEALLVGAIVSSTDASAVFSLLEGVPLRRRVRLLLEAESGLNDPVAVILTAATAANLAHTSPLGWHVLPDIGMQLLRRGGDRCGIGGLGRWFIPARHLSTPALFPALTLALALIASASPASSTAAGFSPYCTSPRILIGQQRPCPTACEPRPLPRLARLVARRA
jgi:cell volume regulation protein A